MWHWIICWVSTTPATSVSRHLPSTFHAYIHHCSLLPLAVFLSALHIVVVIFCYCCYYCYNSTEAELCNPRCLSVARSFCHLSVSIYGCRPDTVGVGEGWHCESDKILVLICIWMWISFSLCLTLGGGHFIWYIVTHKRATLQPARGVCAVWGQIFLLLLLLYDNVIEMM